MFTEGKIKSYHAERGFGFIAIDGEAKDLFFHIKDLPNRNIEPTLGEKLKFQIVEDAGKLKAEHITRINVKTEAIRHTPQSRALANESLQKRKQASQNKKQGSNKLFNMIFGLIILGVFVVVLKPFIFGIYQRAQLSNQPVTPVQTVISQPASQERVVPSQIYTCDGRTHCSQMRSYEEAVFFINNCPGTKMDGNHDGRPCEKQFNR